MTRSILSGAFALLGILAIGLLPSACQSGGVGDPCIPEDEYDPNFAGFKVTQENIESRSFQCDTRICLANFFQGRVTCPLGQAARTACDGPEASCPGEGEKCVKSAANAPECTDNEGNPVDQRCDAFSGGDGRGRCNPEGGFCECGGDDRPCPAGFTCDEETKQCVSYVCHVPGSCQVPKDDAAAGDNAGKGCCVPGTDIPVAPSVCGQCAEDESRDAPNSVYCSCRCGVAEGEVEDENFNFCECPEGFECSEIRPNVGLGDEQLTGKYCIKSGTGTDPINAGSQCGKLADGSFWVNQQCSGSL